MKIQKEVQAIGKIGEHKIIIPDKVKYVLYARKSTESDEKQALSIDSQVKEMLQIAERENLEIIDVRRESHSAKDSGQRPVYKEILTDIRSGRFNGILTWAPDRLSRNAGDLGSLVDMMDQGLLHEIKTYGQSFKNSPNEKFLLMILCSQAKLENDNKSINVKRGLRTRVEMGLWPGPAPTGYLKEKRLDRKCQTYIDPERGQIIKEMFEKVAYQKWTGRKIYHWLKFDINFKTANGNKNLSLGNIFRLLNTPFFYGEFEWPRGSDNWYKGDHEPLISKELYNLVQKQMNSYQLVQSKSLNNKEFAFTKLISCGLCDSGITADEKFKTLKNGSVNRHVYYMCSKSKDKNCKNEYINETDLIKELQKVVDNINIDSVLVLPKIKTEIERMKRFQKILLHKNADLKIQEVDVKDYVKFVLNDGSIEEKREVWGCIESKLVLKNKSLRLV